MDAFAFKVDATGVVTWAKNFGSLTPGNSSVSATARDEAGNTYLAGYFSGTTFTLGSVTLTRIGTQDAFVAKLDASGTVLWAQNSGGRSGASAFGRSIAVDGNGNVYLGGDFANAPKLTTPTLIRIGSRDAFALKLDATGAVVWAKNFGGSGATAYGWSIAVDGSGNVYLGGAFYNAILNIPVLIKIGSTDAFALKLDSTGAVVWAQNFGGAGGATAFGRSIAVDGSGNVYLGGDFNSANLTTPSLTKIGAQDAFVFKLDSGGVAWAKNFGGNGASVFGQSIAVDGSGNVYLGGDLANASLTTPDLTRIGFTDAFAFKLDATGGVAWAKNFGGGGATAYGLGIAVDGSGNVSLGGYFYNADITTPALTRIGNQDALIITNQLATLAFAAGSNGAISGATPQTVGYGGSASAVTALPAPSYHFVNWTGTNGFATTLANPLTVTGVTASMAITANFAIDQYLLTVSLSGSGGGSVNSTLPEPVGLLSCASGSPAGCSNSFAYGTSVTLAATPDWKSSFTGWGTPCSGTGGCTITMAGASGVAAIFDMVPRVRTGGTTPVDYASLQDAYDHAGAGDTLKAKVFIFGENLLLTRNIAVTLAGGYSEDFASVTGATTVLGSLTIEQGTADISNLIFE